MPGLTYPPPHEATSSGPQQTEPKLHGLDKPDKQQAMLQEQLQASQGQVEQLQHQLEEALEQLQRQTSWPNTGVTQASSATEQPASSCGVYGLPMPPNKDTA